MIYLKLILNILVILLSSQMFCQSIEQISDRLSLTNNVAGSLIAALATTLPEIIIPILALLTKHNIEIGVGALLGGPVMLSSLAVFIVAVALLWRKQYVIDNPQTSYDTNCIIKNNILFLIFVLLSFQYNYTYLKYITSSLIIINYCYYVVKTLNSKTSESNTSNNKNIYWLITKLILASIILLLSAKIFIILIHNITKMYNMPRLLFSIIIAPIATELPEIINGINWINGYKYNLALNNITGALAIQSTFLPLILINWINLTHYNHIILTVNIITPLIMAFLIRINLSKTLLLGLLIYIINTIININLF